MGSLRSDMPIVAAFIDDMRAAFGVDVVNAGIRNGLRPDCAPHERFYATENGHTLGAPYVPDPAKVISAEHMVLESLRSDPVAKGRR